MDKLKKLMAACKCSISVSINEHRDDYMTAEQRLKELESFECPPEIEPEIREKIIETDMLVCVRYYPNTPVGFFEIYHYDLDAALDAALACLDS